MPYAKTHIGAGPKGETVVIEIDKKNPAMQRRLWSEFKNKHFYYAEVSHDGRLYVIGDKKTHESFKKQHHLPYTHSRIGAGPNKETIVFEINKKNPFLLNYLKSEFTARHDIKLD